MQTIDWWIFNPERWRARTASAARFGSTRVEELRFDLEGEDANGASSDATSASGSREPRDPLLVTFRRLGLLAARGARAFASVVDLTPQRLDLILRLHAGPLVQKQIAFQLGVTASVVSRLVTALEKLGLVERRWVKEDRRYRLVRLTLRGFGVILKLLDGFYADGYGATAQGIGEEALFCRFQSELEERGIEKLRTEDQSNLLFSMRNAMLVAPLPPGPFRTGRLPQPSPHSRSTYVPDELVPDIDLLQHRTDREMYARHWYAGFKLTAAMRARRPRIAA